MTDEEAKSAEAYREISVNTLAHNEKLLAENEKLYERYTKMVAKWEDERIENDKLREVARDAWGLFIKYGATHPCELRHVDDVRTRLEVLGIEV